MKKRIVVVLITGIILAPLAFASDEAAKSPGEQKMSQIDPLAITCSLDQGTKARSSIASSGNGDTSSSGAAGTARGRAAD